MSLNWILNVGEGPRGFARMAVASYRMKVGMEMIQIYSDRNVMLDSQLLRSSLVMQTDLHAASGLRGR